MPSYGTHLRWRQLHTLTYYLPSHKSSTDCGTNATLLLTLGLDLDPHILIRTRYPSIDLEPHKGPRPPFRFTPRSGSSEPSLPL